MYILFFMEGKMAIFDKEEILKFLQYIDKNGEPITEEEKANYEKILEQISSSPSLQAFLDKKFGEIMIKYIGEHKNILSESQKKLERDSEGYYILDGESFIEREHNGPGVYAKKWIMVNGRSVLIKELDKNNDVNTTLISEQIARSAGYEVATYYPAILDGKKVVITPSFLKIEENSEGDNFIEEIIQGKIISGSNMDISENPKLIRDFFEKKGVPGDAIDELIEKYKSVMLFNIFINLRDGHNGNWGVIKGANNQYRFTPIFDLEGGLSENNFQIRPINIKGSYDDPEMLDYLLDDDRIKVYANRLMNVNMNEVYECIESVKKITIPEETKKENMRIIQMGKQKIQEALIRNEQKRVDKNDGER